MTSARSAEVTEPVGQSYLERVGSDATVATSTCTEILAAPPNVVSDIAATVALLTPQQVRVFELLGEGAPNKVIAKSLRIKETTVKAHVSAILEKLRCANRTQAALIALRHANGRG